MAKGIHGAPKVLLIILGVIAALTVALQVVLNSRIVTNIVDKLAAEHVDGDLNYSRMHISVFPRIKLAVDSLSITYPHDRFSAYESRDWDPYRAEGRCQDADTLASIGSLKLAVNPWAILGGRIRLAYLEVSRLGVFARAYPDSLANWQLFKGSGEPKDTSSKGFSLPWISIGKISVDDARLAYSSASDSLAAALDVDEIGLGGAARLSSERIKVSDAFLDMLLKGEYAGMAVPVRLGAEASMDRDSLCMDIDLKKLDASLAHIPLTAAGRVKLLRDSTVVDGHVSIDGCPLDSLIRNYGPAFTDMARNIDTDALLSLKLDADGSLSGTSIPVMDASVVIPPCHVSYLPLDILASLDLDVEASADRRKVVDACVNKLAVRTDGLGITAGGDADDLLGEDPLFNLSTVAYAKLDSLLKYLPKSLGIRTASGNINLDLSARAHRSNLDKYNFSNASVRGSVVGDRLILDRPADTLAAAVYHPDIMLSSDSDGLLVTADFDSLRFALGSGLAANVKGMKNSARISKVEDNGKWVPRMEVGTGGDRIFVKAGTSRIGVMGASVSASARKRPEMHRRGSGRDSLARSRRFDPSRPRPDYLSEPEFAKQDVVIAIDSTIKRYFRAWVPGGRIKADNGFFASPAMPLRTRLSAMDASFTDNEVRIDTLSARCGTSDVSIKGNLSGIRRAILSKGFIRSNVNIHSKRINVNEIIAAFAKGTSGDIAPGDEEGESFVVDSLDTTGEEQLKMSLVVVPANVDATVRLSADRVNYTDIDVNDLRASVKMKERTLQLLDTQAATEFGNIGLDAYYSTKTKQDISSGLDLKLSQISAEKIIHLLPTVDSMMPALKSFEGNLDLDLSATTQLDTAMNIIIPSLDGIVRISGKDLNISDAGDLKRITRLLLFKNKNIGHINDLNVSAVVHDSKLEVFPFELGVDRYKLALRGMQGLDRSMYYHVSILKSPFLIPFGINLYGTLDNWRFNLGFAKYREGKVPAFSSQLDTMQVNIAQSIRDIFAKGVDNVARYNRRAVAKVGNSAGKIKPYDDISMYGTAESDAIDDLAISLAFSEFEESLQAEVDAALAESYKEINDRLMREYEEMTYDKGMKERIQRLKEQGEKKKKKKK